MTLALDTSALIAMERKDKKVMAKMKELSEIHPITPRLPFISHFEYFLGIKKRKPKKTDKLLEFVNEFPLLPVTKETSNILADLKLKYDEKGVKLSLADLLIASQVIENGLTLVTKDKDFDKIEEVDSVIV